MSRRTQSPAQLAATLVDEWFRAFFVSREAFTPGSVYAAALGSPIEPDGFTIVQERVERDHVREHGAPKNDEEKALVREMAAAEAGYLIGIHVGLRLRSAAPAGASADQECVK